MNRNLSIILLVLVTASLCGYFGVQRSRKNYDRYGIRLGTSEQVLVIIRGNPSVQRAGTGPNSYMASYNNESYLLLDRRVARIEIKRRGGLIVENHPIAIGDPETRLVSLLGQPTSEFICGGGRLVRWKRPDVKFSAGLEEDGSINYLEISGSDFPD